MDRRQMTFIAVFILAFAATAGSAAGMDINEGFVDIKWGTYVGNLNQMKLLDSNEDVAYYVIPDRAYTIFDTEIERVIYGFYQDRFFAVYIDLKSIDSYARLKSKITKKYGYPKISMDTKLNQTNYIWVHEESKIKLKHDETSGKMKLAFYYTPLSSRVNLERQEAYKPPPRKWFPLSDRQKADAIRTYEVFDSYSP